MERELRKYYWGEGGVKITFLTVLQKFASFFLNRVNFSPGLPLTSCRAAAAKVARHVYICKLEETLAKPHCNIQSSTCVALFIRYSERATEWKELETCIRSIYTSKNSHLKSCLYWKKKRGQGERCIAIDYYGVGISPRYLCRFWEISPHSMYQKISPALCLAACFLSVSSNLQWAFSLKQAWPFTKWWPAHSCILEPAELFQLYGSTQQSEDLDFRC